jgi:hypothetical protein
MSGFDLRPVETADVEEVGARDPAEARHVQAARKEAAVDVGKHVGPGPQVRGSAILDRRVHRPEQRADHLMRVGRVPRAHLVDRRREQASAVEDVGVLGEETEDQPRHEMVHVMAARDGAPFGIVPQQLDIEPVQPAGGPDVEGVFGDLPDGGDARQRQEKAEMVREVGIGAGDRRRIGNKVLGFEPLPIRRQDELRLGPGRRRTGLQRGEGLRDLARRANGDMDVVGLKDATQVGPVRLALAQPLERRFLVPEGLQEGEGKLASVERPLRERRYGLFNLYGVHTARSRTIFSAAP